MRKGLGEKKGRKGKADKEWMKHDIVSSKSLATCFTQTYKHVKESNLSEGREDIIIIITYIIIIVRDEELGKAKGAN